MSNVFKYLDSISYTKKDVYEEYGEKDYVPFLINKGLSYFPDTILYANDMNFYNFLDKKLQYHYLINSIRPRKRFSKWSKPVNDDRIDLIIEYYRCSRQKAKTILSLLNNEQLKIIQKEVHKGGLKNDN